MTLTKRKGVYHAVVETTKGSKKAISTGSSNKAEAQRIVKESGVKDLEMAAKAGRLTQQAIGQITTGRKMTLTKAVQAYEEWSNAVGRSIKTTHNNVNSLNTWLAFENIGSLPPSAVTEEHVNRFINNQRSEAGAAQREFLLAGIRSFFEFTGAKGWSIGNPAKLVRVNMNLLSHEQKERKETVPFTKSEVNKVVRAAHDREDYFWEAATLISWETGLRLGDICQLEWDCLNRPNRIVVWTDKRDKRVAVPISEQLAELFSSIPVMSQQYIFPDQRMVARDPKRRSLLSVQFMRLCQRCEIEGKTFHGLRHAFITEMKRKGLTLEEIGELVGHSDTKTTEGYVHD